MTPDGRTGRASTGPATRSATTSTTSTGSEWSTPGRRSIWRRNGPTRHRCRARASLRGRSARRFPDAPQVGNPATVTRTLTIDSPIGFTEFIEVKVDFQHVSFRDLEIELVSPSGAVSRLAESFDTRSNELGVVPIRGGFRFGSGRHLGEDPNGEWQLRVTDRVPGIGGTLRSWSLKIYGHQAVPGPPTVDSVTAGPGSLTVAWEAFRRCVERCCHVLRSATRADACRQ